MKRTRETECNILQCTVLDRGRLNHKIELGTGC